MRNQWGFLASLLFLVPAAACGGSSSGDIGGGDAGTSVEQACTDSAHARCQKLASCSQTVFQQRYADETSCESLEKAACEKGLAAPTTRNAPSVVEACIATYPGYDCQDFLVSGNLPSACQLPAGGMANGAACAFSGQCQSGYCSVGPGAACATCADLPTEGSPCETTSCPGGLSCSGNKKCEVPVQKDGSCDADHPCAPGLGCAMQSKDVKTCVPIDSVVAAGQPCGTLNGKRIGCADGTCEKAPSGSNGDLCVAHATVGAACNDTGGPTCEATARCIQGTCQVADAQACH